MNEIETVNVINNKVNTKLILKEDEFCDYDAEDNNYICEIKNRRKYYADKIIEAVKLFKNFRHSTLLDKQFIYVVTDERGIWIYNITNNIENIILFKPLIYSMPVSTDFKNNNKINKYCYTLKESIAFKMEL